MLKIRIVRTVGEYQQDAEFEIDEQVARQLVADGTAKIVGTEKQVKADAAPARQTEVAHPKK